MCRRAGRQIFFRGRRASLWKARPPGSANGADGRSVMVRRWRAASACPSYGSGPHVGPAPASPRAQIGKIISKRMSVMCHDRDLRRGLGERRAKFTKGRAEVPNRDGAKFTLLLRRGSVSQAKRPERELPFIPLRRPCRPPFFLTSALVRRTSMKAVRAIGASPARSRGATPWHTRFESKNETN